MYDQHCGDSGSQEGWVPACPIQSNYLIDGSLGSYQTCNYKPPLLIEASSGRSKIGPLLGVRWIPQGRIRACAETRRVPSSSTRPSMLTLCMMNLAEPERTPLPGTVPHIRGCFHSGRSAPQTGGVLRLAERSLSIES